MALTESQKVAMRRIMTNAPGTPNREMVRTALETGMSEREIMRTLRKGVSTSKPTSSMLGASRQDRNRKASQRDAMSMQTRKATTKPLPLGKRKAVSGSTMDESYSPAARKATSKPTSGMMADIKRAFSLDNDILKYMRENTPGDALMQLAEKAKGPKLKRKPSVVVQAEKAVKEKAAPTSGAARKKTKAPKAKNYNVGVSQGGVPFKEAFAHFRKKGAKTFTWNGKKYHTKTKEEMRKGGYAKKK